MAKSYYKREDGVYKPYFWSWSLFSVISVAYLMIMLVFILSLIVFRFLIVELSVLFQLWFMMLVFSFLYFYFLSLKVKKFGSFRIFVDCLIVKHRITDSLLSTMILDKSKSSNEIIVPDVFVRYFDNQYFVEIEKLSGMYNLNIDKLNEDVSAAFRGRRSNYNVVSSMVTDDMNYFQFLLEDVGSDKTFVPDKIEDFVRSDSYELILQDNLIVNLADSPHIAVWGKSGSGKSTLLFSLIGQLLVSGADLRVIDGKEEFSSLNSFYPKNKIASNLVEILSVLKDVCLILEKRQTLVADKIKINKNSKLGARGYDFGLKPVVLVVDEIGALLASLSSADKKLVLSYLLQIAQKGRSTSVFLITSTQSPKADIIPTEIRSQYATKILLGNAQPETIRMAFDNTSLVLGGVGKYKGYYMSDGFTQVPSKFFVPNLHANNLMTVSFFEELYKKGQSKK